MFGDDEKIKKLFHNLLVISVPLLKRKEKSGTGDYVKAFSFPRQGLLTLTARHAIPEFFDKLPGC